MSRTIHRRGFLKTTSALGAAALSAGVWSELRAAESTSPNEKLNIAGVGTGGMAGHDIKMVSGENIVALCDIDERTLGKASEQYRKARTYHDFRKMLEKEDKHIDAVVVATPDHIHAPASVMAMRLGKHCYCEKPLAYSVHETRVMTETAARQKLATQMGTGIHAGTNYRRVVEIVQSGAIGKVREVEVWCHKAWGGGERPVGGVPVPKHVHWDLWLGPAPERPYHPEIYHPGQWRRWWDFGEGTLGDMACHLMDLPFWALELGHPTSVATEGPPVHAETAPLGLRVDYEFPARGALPPVKLTWRDGTTTPSKVAGHDVPGMGVMFIGESGQMFADYGRYVLYPQEKFRDFTPPPPTIPDSIGHWNEWIKACKEGTPTTCDFDYSGPLSEAVLLGVVSYRVGQKLDWDAASLTATNCPKAAQYVERETRKGWTL